MAQTYMVSATGVGWSTANKVLFSLYNGSGSGRIVRISRIWVVNNQITAVTGVLENFSLFKLTTDTSGGTPTTLTPVKLDSINEDIPAQIVCRTNNTTNGTGVLLRRYYFSGDEPAVGTFSWDELETFFSLNCIWDVGYGNSQVQKLTLREGEGISLYQAAIASSVGNIDIFVEFLLSTT